MAPTEEAEWPDEFTREEMLEQQSHLLTEECQMVKKELSRYRKNLEKLVDMHSVVSVERDKLRAELIQTKSRLSDCLLENSSLNNRIGGLESCRDQMAAIHRAERERHVALSAVIKD